MNFCSTFVAVFLLDRVGRKPLLACGAGLQAVCMVTLASVGVLFARIETSDASDSDSGSGGEGSGGLVIDHRSAGVVCILAICNFTSNQVLSLFMISRRMILTDCWRVQTSSCRRSRGHGALWCGRSAPRSFRRGNARAGSRSPRRRIGCGTSQSGSCIQQRSSEWDSTSSLCLVGRRCCSCCGVKLTSDLP